MRNESSAVRWPKSNACDSLLLAFSGFSLVFSGGRFLGPVLAPNLADTPPNPTVYYGGSPATFGTGFGSCFWSPVWSNFGPPAIVLSPHSP